METEVVPLPPQLEPGTVAQDFDASTDMGTLNKAARPRGFLSVYFGKWLGKVKPAPVFSLPPWKWNPRWYATGFVGSFLAIAIMGLFDQYAAFNVAQRGIVFSMGAAAVLCTRCPRVR
jgi:hypothetical protein